MGNRILKESILYSIKLTNNITPFEQVMFYRLIVIVDDYGIFYADPTTVGRSLFPTDENVRTVTIRKGLDHLEKQGLIFRYTVDGISYLKLVSWEKHQRLRNSRRKFPAPEDAEQDPAGSTAPVSVQTHDQKSVPAAKPEPAPEPVSAPENAGPAPAEVHELPVVELPLNDNSVYGVTREQADEYAILYPAVDIAQELRNMRGWCMANPQKRKTRSGIRKFINNWLAKAQNQGGCLLSAKGRPPENPFIKIATEGIDQSRQAGGIVDSVLFQSGGRSV